MRIQDIHMPKGAHKPARRIGRGSGSGHGKTSGRGSKGAKSRSGFSRRIGFEGGQMPLIRRIPKRGFTSVAKKKYQLVNLERLNSFRKDSSIDKAALKQARIIKNVKLPVKILGKGKLSKPLVVEAEAFSKAAEKAISEAGGKVKVLQNERQRTLKRHRS